MAPTVKKQLRFRRQDAKHLVGVQEEHTAEYGALLFTVTRRPDKWKYSPGSGVRADVTLGWTDSPQYYYKAKTVQGGKEWCRGALSYILRGHVPFGDHTKADE